MVPRQVREHGDPEVQADHPVLVERVRRAPPSRHACAGVAHLRQRAVEQLAAWAWCTVAGRCAPASELDRADHAGLAPAPRRNASTRYVVVVLPFVPVTPMSVIAAAGSPSERPTSVADALIVDGTITTGTRAPRPAPLGLALDHHRRRALFDRLGDERVAIAA